MREKKVGPPDGLSTLKMGVSWKEDIFLLVCAFTHDTDETLEPRRNVINSAKEPETSVSSDLVVARTTGVEFTTKGTDELTQTTFVGSVDILIVRHNLKLELTVSKVKN